MKAVIMAGGEGTRLRPLTCNIPKPMVSVLDKPVMEHMIGLLKRHGITEIVVTLQYLPNEIKDYFADGSDFGVHLSYYVEDKPLGTAGSVKNAQAELTEPFLVVSGDAVTDIDLTKAIDYHREKQSVATLVLKRETSPLEYGVVVTDDSGRITRFIEKPSWSEVFSDTVNTGIYVLDPSVFEYYQADEFFDFSKDLFPALLNDQKPLFGYVAEGYWCDVGDLSAYLRCQFDAMEGRVNLEAKPPSMTPGIFVGENTNIEKGAIVRQPVFIGAGATIKNGASVGPYAVIGANAVVQNYASVKKSLLLPGAHLGRCAEVRGAIVGRHATLKDGVSAFEGAVIGDSCVIGPQAKVEPQIKIWPGKHVEGATVVADNLVWGSYHSRALFNENAIVGEVNVDITPEYASKLGAAYGSLHKGKKVAVASDGKEPSAMLTGSFIAGMLSAGAKVLDLGSQVFPALRFGVEFFGLSGGAYLKSSGSNFHISLLDAYGANIRRETERKIEGVFLRDDFTRCEAQDIAVRETMEGFSQVFARQMVNRQSVTELSSELSAECASPQARAMLEDVLRPLGCTMSFENVYAKPGSAIGLLVDDTLDSLVLIDEENKRISDDKLDLLRVLLLLKNELSQEVVLPVSASQAAFELADRYKATVLRAKTGAADQQAMMNRTTSRAQFYLTTNPLYFLLVLLGTLKKENTTLHHLLKEIPAYYKATSFVDCGFEQKGEVIRKLAENHPKDQTELLEGVKIFLDRGWTLIVPDNDMPVFKIISEGYSEEYARDLSAGICAEVEALLGKNR